MKQLSVASVSRQCSAQKCARELLETIPSLMQHIREVANLRRDPRLTVAQFRAMGYLRRRPGASLSALAEYLGLSLPTASRSVETLARKGLVHREPLPKNRRQIRLQLSNRGAKLLETALDHIRRQLAVQLRQLSTPRRGQIVQSLHVLCDLFEAGFRRDDAATTEHAPGINRSR